jgi:hypothetical protein
MVYGYNISKEDSSNEDNLVSGFLSAVNLFANAMKWPSGTLLIRAGTLECRIRTGKGIFTALFIENNKNLDDMCEPVLGDLTQDIGDAFERDFGATLQKQLESGIIMDQMFAPFSKVVESVLSTTAAQTLELYNKLILIKSLYAKVPQKWIFPLMTQVAMNEPIKHDLQTIAKKYRVIKKVIEEVNETQASVWHLFDIPMYQSEDF